MTHPIVASIRRFGSLRRAYFRSPGGRANLLILLFVLSWQAGLPFFPVLAQRAGLDAPEIGLLVGIQGVAGLVAIFPVSAMLGRFGPARLGIVGGLVAAVGWVALWLTPTAAAFFLAMPFLGVAQMVMFMSVQMLVVTESSDETRAQAVGMFLFYTSVGMTLGPLVGSAGVRAVGSLEGAFLAAGVVAVVAVLVAFLIPSVRPSEPPVRQRLMGWMLPLTKSARLSLLTTGVGDFVYVSWGILFPLLATSMAQGPALIGTAFAVRGIANMVVRPTLGMLLARISPRGLMAAALATLSGGFWISLSLISSPAAAHVGAALFGLGCGLLFPLSFLLLTTDAVDHRLPQLLGLRQFVGRVGQIGGPVITGALLAVSQAAAVAAAVVLALGTIPFFLRLPSRHERGHGHPSVTSAEGGSMALSPDED